MSFSAMIILFGMLQGILVMAVFFQKDKLKQHQLLLIFLVALLFVQFHAFLLESGLMFHVLFLLNSNIPVVFLFGPLILFYTYQMLEKEVSWKKLVPHLIPFGFYLVYAFNFFLQPANYKHNLLVEMLGLELALKPFTKTFDTDPWDIQGWVVVEMMCLHLVVYSGVALYQTWKSTDNSPSLKWLRFVNITLLFSGVILFLSEGGVVNGYVFMKHPLPAFAGDLFATIAMYGMTLILLFRTEAFQLTKRKYKKSGLSEDFMTQKLKLLKKAIESEKLYLQQDFSLDLLSQKTGISRHHISQMINQKMGLTFAQLTNDYRTEEAKRLLQKNAFTKMEVLAYDLGYKSKSSFYNAFKKSTDLTPAQYFRSYTNSKPDSVS